MVVSSGYGKADTDADTWNLPKPYGLPELQSLVERVQATVA